MAIQPVAYQEPQLKPLDPYDPDAELKKSLAIMDLFSRLDDRDATLELRKQNAIDMQADRIAKAEQAKANLASLDAKRQADIELGLTQKAAREQATQDAQKKAERATREYSIISGTYKASRPKWNGDLFMEHDEIVQALNDAELTDEAQDFSKNFWEAAKNRNAMTTAERERITKEFSELASQAAAASISTNPQVQQAAHDALAKSEPIKSGRFFLAPVTDQSQYPGVLKDVALAVEAGQKFYETESQKDKRIAEEKRLTDAANKPPAPPANIVEWSTIGLPALIESLGGATPTAKQIADGYAAFNKTERSDTRFDQELAAYNASEDAKKYGQGPEGMRKRDAAAKLAQDKQLDDMRTSSGEPLYQIERNGQLVWVPRSQAVGQNAVRTIYDAAGNPTTGGIAGASLTPPPVVSDATQNALAGWKVSIDSIDKNIIPQLVANKGSLGPVLGRVKLAQTNNLGGLGLTPAQIKLAVDLRRLLMSQAFAEGGKQLTETEKVEFEALNPALSDEFDQAIIKAEQASQFLKDKYQAKLDMMSPRQRGQVPAAPNGPRTPAPAAGGRNPQVEATAKSLGITYDEAETRLRKLGAIK